PQAPISLYSTNGDTHHSIHTCAFRTAGQPLVCLKPAILAGFQTGAPKFMAILARAYMAKNSCKKKRRE
ncbi:MAG: hypothetical protein V2A66_06445, partial [Pseudomonadota bacterium]